MTHQNKTGFREAVQENNMAVVSELLGDAPELVNLDLRPSASQDHFTQGFALTIAADHGHVNMVKLLLKNGADPNAAGIDQVDPPEFGLPICLAVENKDYEMANLLLDHGASINAFPYCDLPMIEKLFNQARKAGVASSTIRKGFTKYLGPYDLHEPGEKHPDVIKLYHRVLNLGVEHSLSTIVRDENMPLIADLLKTCATKPCTKLSYPAGSFFENIVYQAAWYGYPKILQLCMDLCPDLFNGEISRQSIYRAIISHNRDGTNEDYIKLIQVQLEFLKSIDKLEWIKSEKSLYPFHELAKHFLNKDTYGCKAPLTTGSDLINIARLFLSFGFNDFDKKHPSENLTAIEKAKARLDHEGMVAYVTFLDGLD